MPDPKKPNLSAQALRNAEKNRMTRSRYDAMSTEQKDAYHARVNAEEKASAEARLEANKTAGTESEAMAAERASEDIARINVRKKKNEIYKKKYGTNPESDDISTLEKRGYFRVDFGDEGFQHGETYSGEEDTRRRREEYYARRGSTAPNKFLDYQKRIANMGKQILSNTRGNG